ncbi:MAG TPA: hypothetical protein VJX69_17240 [Terriglobales bacterium]|nr:hypothetical protein [Terriglobales bacterium]
MNRREFLAYVSAAMAVAALPRFASGTTADATLRVGFDRTLSTMPLDFAGFSYESAQLADSTYFSGANLALVEQFRKLSNRGVLRLGGNLSDVTLWNGGPKATSLPSSAQRNIQARFEWRLVGRRAGENRPATITPESIRALGSFLQATGWKLIYGLNLGTGTPERAAEEAACVAENAGGSLLAFQVGNEADFFGRSFRRHGWDFSHYWDEYQSYAKAIRARVPHAPFAGPDVAANRDWLRKFAERAKGDAVLLTSHYYAMGPPEDTKMNAQRLLRRDPHLAREVPMLVAAAKAAGMPYRMDEGNSCFHGGKPGVSDAFASALWGADYLLFLAQAGCAGVNLHSGGEAVYAAFVEESLHIKKRPLFFGMEFAQRFASATFLATRLDAHSNVAVYVARRGEEILLAVINKDLAPVSIDITGLPGDVGRAKESWSLTAPSLEATADVEFRASAVPDVLPRIRVPQYSAKLLVL